MQDEHSTSPLLEVSDAEISNSANENDLFRLKGGVRTWALIWENIVRLGLREFTLRLGTGLALIVLALLVVWVMGNFYLKGQVAPGEIAAQAAPLPTATVTVEPVAVEDVPADAFMGGIGRLAQIHTILPSRPRFEIIEYKVLKGDTLIGIAEKFGLRPESIFWGNYNVLGDDPHKLRIGQNLNILPVDGILYQWHQGDGLNSVAKFYGVSVESIINWPGNHLDTKTIGDVSHPNISAGTEVMIPGGKREFVTWSAPRITRANPSLALAPAGKWKMARWGLEHSSGRRLKNIFQDTIIPQRPTIGVSISQVPWGIPSSHLTTAWWFMPGGTIGVMEMWS
jgi:hypothetical protein